MNGRIRVAHVPHATRQALHPGRYWSVMVLDAYTHVAYISRRNYGAGGATVRVTLDPTSEPSRTGGDLLTMGTPTVWVLVRVLVDSPDDLAAARAVQRAITIRTPPDHPIGRTETTGQPNLVHEAGAGFFDELRSAIGEDPPARWHPQMPSQALAVLDGTAALCDDNLEVAVHDGDDLAVENLLASIVSIICRSSTPVPTPHLPAMG